MLKRRRCRDELRLLLPFHVNGSLTGAQAEAVRAHVDACPVCSREYEDLRTLARVVDRAGWVPGSLHAGGAGRQSARRIALRAALVAGAVLVLIAAYSGVTGRWPFGPGDSSLRAGRAGIAVLDLGPGLTRDGAEPPVLDLPPGAPAIRFSLVVPVRPGARYLAEIRDAEGRVIVADRQVGPPDSLGRIEFDIPAGKDPGEGAGEILLWRVHPDSSRDLFRYPFNVRRPGAAPGR